MFAWSACRCFRGFDLSCREIRWLTATTFCSTGHTIDSRFGALAHLGERLLCKQEVEGSIPSSSTKLVFNWKSPRRNAGAFLLVTPKLLQ